MEKEWNKEEKQVEEQMDKYLKIIKQNNDKIALCRDNRKQSFMIIKQNSGKE